MMANIRTQVLELIANQRASTVDQLSRVLQVTPANIRHHLANLQEEGVVEEGGVRPSQGRGRPRKIYRLTATARHNNLAGLLHAMLALNRSNLHDPGLTRTARQLAGTAGDMRGVNPARRLFVTIQRLNGLHYQARWEAHADSPRILLGNCPYADLVGDFPELCQMDGSLLEELTGMPATQTAKLEPDPLGAVQCVFHLVVGK